MKNDFIKLFKNIFLKDACLKIEKKTIPFSSSSSFRNLQDNFEEKMNKQKFLKKTYALRNCFDTLREHCFFQTVIRTVIQRHFVYENS